MPVHPGDVHTLGMTVDRESREVRLRAGQSPVPSARRIRAEVINIDTCVRGRIDRGILRGRVCAGISEFGLTWVIIGAAAAERLRFIALVRSVNKADGRRRLVHLSEGDADN